MTVDPCLPRKVEAAIAVNSVRTVLRPRPPPPPTASAVLFGAPPSEPRASGGARQLRGHVGVVADGSADELRAQNANDEESDNWDDWVLPDATWRDEGPAGCDSGMDDGAAGHSAVQRDGHGRSCGDESRGSARRLVDAPRASDSGGLISSAASATAWVAVSRSNTTTPGGNPASVIAYQDTAHKQRSSGEPIEVRHYTRKFRFFMHPLILVLGKPVA